MLDHNHNIVFNALNSCACMINTKAIKLRFSGLNPDLHAQGESRLNGFFAFKSYETVKRETLWASRVYKLSLFSFLLRLSANFVAATLYICKGEGGFAFRFGFFSFVSLLTTRDIYYG